MSHLDIVHISSVCVHIIWILSEHMRIMHILSALVLHMFFPNRQCQCDLYVISTTLYRSYDVQLSFHTLFTQTHIVNAIYMLYAHIHIICYVSFTFLIYLITCNLISAYCLHTHMLSAHHLYVICTATHGQHGPELEMTYRSHWHCLLGRKISRTTADNMRTIHMCSDNMQMTCTYADEM